MTQYVEQEQLLLAVVRLSARIDALTWVAGALLQAHPRPDVVLAAWRGRQADAADSGFEIESEAYRDKFLEELKLWTNSLEAYSLRRI